MIRVTREGLDDDGFVVYRDVAIPEKVKGLKSAESWLRKAVKERKLAKGVYHVEKITQSKEIIL